MEIKTLTAILCSSALFLTACGGGSDHDNYTGKEISNVDYSKSQTIELITPRVFSFTKNIGNPFIYMVDLINEIYYISSNPNEQDNQATCESGTVQKNEDNSITLNNCKNLRVNGNIATNLRNLTLSGTVQSKFTGTPSIEKHDITLTYLTIKYSDLEQVNYHGHLLRGVTDNKIQYDANKLEITGTEPSNKEHLLLNDYHLTISSTPVSSLTSVITKGFLQANNNGQKYTVKFDSDIEFPSGKTIPNSAIINIEDTKNNKNAISIKNTTSGQALVSAFAEGRSVTGYPKTMEWRDLRQ
ncbi:hypothetical protein F2A31_05945 [Acinetobacter suaedae]|uniref:Lipoprotein n=1 Tax=Acinetobacter suaedae TaxID=2609668 RepID=A0A5P1UVS4_9GAMM|nr:hypothetical protein [Acinetobacter sp. C16S1]QER39266.1 hypothetical protein F2A31_05945 [Acinetobacter sp. C16S1]